MNPVLVSLHIILLPDHSETQNNKQILQLETLKLKEKGGQKGGKGERVVGEIGAISRLFVF